MFTRFDTLLIVAVSTQCLLMAYIRDPLIKSRMMLVPFPVLLGILAVNRPVDVTNTAGLVLSLTFTLLVLGLHTRLRVRIVPAIALPALAYGLAGAALAKVLPSTLGTFWSLTVFTFAIAVSVLRLMPPRAESGYRSAMPVWMKTCLTVAVVTLLVLAKQSLRGFLTTFPMLGVVGYYETRRSLYTTCRQIPVSVAAFSVMFGVCHLLQPHVGLHLALLPALIVYASIVFTLSGVVAGGSSRRSSCYVRASAFFARRSQTAITSPTNAPM